MAKNIDTRPTISEWINDIWKNDFKANIYGDLLYLLPIQSIIFGADFIITS